MCIVETEYRIRIPIPAGIETTLCIAIVWLTIRIVCEDVSDVVKDDVEYDVNAVVMRGCYEFSEFLIASEPGIHLQIVLNAIAMICFLK